MGNDYYYLKLTPREWNEKKDLYYDKLFGFIREDLDRIDYCVVVLRGKDVAGFVTCKELDRDTVYWQYGGVLPQFQGAIHSPKGYAQLVSWFGERYEHVRTRIERGNAKMLRLALKVGFLIEGVVMFNDQVLVELNYQGDR